MRAWIEKLVGLKIYLNDGTTNIPGNKKERAPEEGDRALEIYCIQSNPEGKLPTQWVSFFATNQTVFWS